MTTVSMLASLGGSSAYVIPKSLRFKSASYTNLTFTPTITGNTNVWTLSTWVRRSKTSTGSSFAPLLTAYANSNTYTSLFFSSADVFELNHTYNNTTAVIVNPNQRLQDTSAWYHIVVSANSPTSVNFYINGVLQTGSSILVANTFCFNTSGQTHYIGSDRSGYGQTTSFDGYLAEYYWIDGQNLPASSFGTFDSNGIWQPIKYSGTYGTNGYYLNFQNNANLTALGYDSSGNNNNFTVGNASLTANITYDVTPDSPTSSSSTVSSYCTLNAASLNNATTNIANGGLQWGTSTGSIWLVGSGTHGFNTGKYYFEASLTTLGTGASGEIGVGLSGQNVTVQNSSTTWTYSKLGWSRGNGSNGTTYGNTFGVGDIIGVAVDAGAQTLTFYKNNVSQGTAFTNFANVTSGQTFLTPIVSMNNAIWNVNFGQVPYTYSPPSGFANLNTYNLAAPTITNGAKYYATTQYSGNSATQYVNNGNNNTIGTTLQPDLVWIKSTSYASGHYLFDSVRGATNYITSNSTIAEATNATSLTAFNANGFTLGADSQKLGVNVTGNTYVAFQWQAGGTATSNTSGSITSNVSVNTTSGFSIVSYTGTGASATVGHGLNSTPALIIVKNRTSASDWAVYHSSAPNANSNILFLDTNAAATTSGTYWNNTSPTSTTFTIANATPVNVSSANHIAYCWTPVYGYSAFGSYTGAGSATYPFIYTGFRPAFLMIKSYDNTSDWYVYSDVGGYNPLSQYVLADTSAVAAQPTSLSLLSNGFAFKFATAAMNASGNNYIYAAFAENPFNIARAR